LFFGGSVKAEEDIDLALKSRVVGEAHPLRGDSPFAAGLPLTAFGRDRIRLEEEARGKAGPFSLLLTVTELSQEAQLPKYKLVGNEIYTDFSVDQNHFTVGKKILSGDVGYGFRPIDVLQREQRLQVLPPALTGVPNLTWERFTADQAWSLIWTNPGHGERSDPKTDGALATRYYQRWGNTDLHAVARASNRYGLEAGAAFSTVPSESVELHGSFLQIKHDETGVARQKALGGFTWTWANGWSLLGESWWDGTAPTAAAWKNLAASAANLQSVPAALAGLTRLFQAPSYARGNVLARIAWTDPKASGWSASLDVLRTLQDGGYTATAAIGYEADRLRLDAGLRRFGGRPDAAYRLFPERGIVFAGASIAF
jgi:hypothetical protein